MTEDKHEKKYQQRRGEKKKYFFSYNNKTEPTFAESHQYRGPNENRSQSQ